MKPARPDPPRSLGVAGRRAWRAALAGLADDLQFTAKELDLVRLVAGQADLVDRLERELARAPTLIVEGNNGQPRPHPLAALLSSARLAQAKLWTEVRLEVDAAGELPVKNRRAQRAAHARHHAKREAAKERAALYSV